MKAIVAAVVAGSIATGAAAFSDWTHQRFSLFSGNDWQQGANAVSVTSDGTVSLLWTALPESAFGTRNASWTWRVEESVPATALDRKGGDDRNLSLYFIFMPAGVARTNADASIRQLMEIEQARILMYVWGGQADRGTILPSPYLGAQGRTVVLRAAGTGAHSERVDLAADYRRAFGAEPTALAGLALSADSDDTDSRVRARLSNLRLE